MGRAGGTGGGVGERELGIGNLQRSDAFDLGDDAYILGGIGADASFGDTEETHGGEGSDDSFDAANELELVTAARTIEKISVGYATKAKRVDVKQLKQNLWTEIRSTAPIPPDVANKGTNENIAVEPQTDQYADQDADGCSDGMLSFTSVVDTMSPRVSSQVTIPFYFICVLHLANEKGLKLTGNDLLTDFSIELN